VERKGLLSTSQTRFGKGMEAIDNVYVLNYLMNRQLGKEKRRMVAMFIDLKGAFAGRINKQRQRMGATEKMRGSGVDGDMSGGKGIRENERKTVKRL